MFRLSINQSRLATLGGICLIIGTALVIYFPALSGDFLVDDELLTQNLVVKASDGLVRIWCTTEPMDYWPVTNSMFWIEWRLWGTNPTGYHVVNLILHVVDSLLVWAVLRQLSIPGAFLAALLFTVHPVNVESVAWIAQCKNLLAMLFFLLSILYWLKWDGQQTARRHTIHESQTAFRGVSPYWLSLFWFLLAMLSKGSVAILPLVLMLIAWWRRRKFDARAILRIAPFFLFAAVLTFVNIWFQTHGAINSALRDVTFLQRLLGAGAIVWFYLCKALWPIGLVFVYPQWKIDAVNPVWWLPLLATLIVTGVLIWQRNGRRTSWIRPTLFAWSYFCVALLSVMGFVPVAYMKFSLVADHYQHLAIIGILALLVVAVAYALDRIHLAMRSHAVAHQAEIFMQCVVATAVAAVLVTLSCLARQQSTLYGNSFCLYQNAAEKNPDNWLTQYDLGYALIDLDRREEAFQRFQKAIELKPDEPNAYNSLGNALKEDGKIPEAIANYRQAVQLQPNFATAHYNLAATLAEQGDLRQAIDYYQQAIRIQPDWAEAHYNLGRVLVKTSQRSEAILQFQQAIDAKSDYADAHEQLGLMLVDDGKLPEAITHLQQALQLKPNSAEAHNNLGIALKKSGKTAEAIDHYQQALILDLGFAEAHNNLGNALLQSGKIDEAIEHFQKAMQLNPNYAQACIGLAMAYQQENQPVNAIAAGQKAVGLARAAGQIELAEKTEAWLTSYRDHPVNSHAELPSADSNTAPSQ
jgi:tetratricopeptide (TPR) repeat protein